MKKKLALLLITASLLSSCTALPQQTEQTTPFATLETTTAEATAETTYPPVSYPTDSAEETTYPPVSFPVGTAKESTEASTTLVPSTTTAAQTEPRPNESEPVYLFESHGDGTCTLTGIASPVDHVDIPAQSPAGDTVTAIGAYAFSNTYRLKSAVIPEGVITIEKSAFELCSNLADVTLPSTLKSIGDYAFKQCFAMTALELPRGLETLGAGALSGTQIADIRLPYGLTEIAPYLFSSCMALKSIYIPENVKSIGSNAFASCFSLTSISLPVGLEYIGGDAFLHVPKTIYQTMTTRIISATRKIRTIS